MKSIITPLMKYRIVEQLESTILSTSANTYVCIGRPIRWGADSNETVSEIEDIEYTTNYRNQVFRDMIAMKKVVPADTQLVIPRVDWASGIKYDIYNDHVELFSYTSQLTVGNVNITAGQTLVNADAAGIFTGTLSVGNTITVGTETREIINISAATGNLNVNSAFTVTHDGNSLVRVDNTYPKYASCFYVRNSKDQVFKCLYNANTTSTVEPTIDIDGQLPENPYIETGDDYKWKYLYTIPYGLKQKFFTSTWMPVVNNATVVAGSENGRIDVIEILSGGDGYFLDGQSGNSNSLSIITITGDGEGANVTAVISSGVITDLNILDGGANYTFANVVVSDPDQLATGNAASFDVIIGPRGGHGSDPARELGCFTVMTTVDFEGTESGEIPVTGSSDFDFRQISLIRDPLTANGLYANASVYKTATVVTLTDPGITNFTNDETAFAGNTLEASTFNAVVVHWDPNSNELWLNNKVGTLGAGDQLTGNVSGAVATVLSVTEPDVEVYSGDLLYIENKQKVIRSTNQTEQVRLILAL